MKDDRGWVLMSFWQCIPKIFKIGEETYLFQMSHNVSASWVRPEHVDRMLSYRPGGCCGGNRQQFYLTSDTNYRQWSGISER